MGLDYSIELFVKIEKFSDALIWMSEKLCQHGEHGFLRGEGDEYIRMAGNCFRKDRDPVTSIHMDIDDHLSFTTCLIFDIDPVIINSLCSHYPYLFDLGTFKEDFENYYLGSGKIRIGDFNVTIIKHATCNAYQIVFTAVTTAMSTMLIESLSVRKWVEEFSEASGAIVSYIDMESAGHKILFYKGKKIDITFSEPYDVPQDEAGVFFSEYFNLIKNK